MTACQKSLTGAFEGAQLFTTGGNPMNYPLHGVEVRFIGDHKYWLMTHWEDLEPGGNHVINRARLYRDRRDFLIQTGDTGKPEDYPANPAR